MLRARHRLAKAFGASLGRQPPLGSGAALMGLIYLRIFKYAEGPEIVCQVVV